MKAFRRGRNPLVGFSSPKNHPFPVSEGQPHVCQVLRSKTKGKGGSSSCLYLELILAVFLYLPDLKYNGSPWEVLSRVSKAAALSEENLSSNFQCPRLRLGNISWVLFDFFKKFVQ